MLTVLPYDKALAEPILINRPIPVAASTVPQETRRWAVRALVGQHGWLEIECLLSTQGGCEHGCKLYARRWGHTVRYAVFHLSTYGHRRPAPKVA